MILHSHSDEVSEKEFNEQYLPIFVSSCDYYESLNAILFEYPRMFKKQIFYNRVIKVLECNQKLNYDKTVCRGNKKIIKRIEKQIKKYK